MILIKVMVFVIVITLALAGFVLLFAFLSEKDEKTERADLLYDVGMIIAGVGFLTCIATIIIVFIGVLIYVVNM